MDAILIRSRYKVTHIQHAQDQYAALMAVDLESRDKREYLLNVYEGQLVKTYVDSFDRLRHCPAYHGIFMDKGSLVAVFDAVDGAPIDQVFYKGAQVSWQERVDAAQALFHLGLSISDYPPEIACAALLSDNLRFWPKEGRLEVQYQVRPMEDMNPREEALLLMDQIKKVLLRRFSSPKAEIRFLDSLEEQAFLTPVALYSHWLRAKEGIIADYEAWRQNPPCSGPCTYASRTWVDGASGCGKRERDAKHEKSSQVFGFPVVHRRVWRAAVQPVSGGAGGYGGKPAQRRWTRTFIQAVQGADGVAYALEAEPGGGYSLYGASAEGRVSQRPLSEGLPQDFSVEQIYVAKNGCILLGLYERAGMELTRYALYAGLPEQPFQLLLEAPLSGITGDQRRASAGLLYVTADGELVELAVLQEGEYARYTFDPAQGQGLVAAGALGEEEVQAAQAANEAAREQAGQAVALAGLPGASVAWLAPDGTGGHWPSSMRADRCCYRYPHKAGIPI